MIGAKITLVLSGAGLIGLGAFAVQDRFESNPSARLAGPAQVVFNWSQDACDQLDYPDLPVRAFRDAGGRVQLLSSHFANRRFVGRDLSHVRHECPLVMASDDASLPSLFNGREWLASPYSADGKTIYALVHNEFQGHRKPVRCRSGRYQACWYNAVTLAVSRDGGKTYDDARRPPGHLVAAFPSRYVPDRGPLGIFEPSNIVRNPRDGYYYAFARIVGPDDRPRGACLLRTRALSDPSSWRGWDGSGFTVRFRNPYRARGDICRPLAHDRIQEMTQSLTYNTYFKRFMLVGTASLEGRRRGRWGFHFALSDDLIHWSPRRLIMNVEAPWTFRCGDKDPVAYPSVIDPKSASRNFETVGRLAYLYYTRFRYRNCKQGPDRDLMRVRIEFAK